jgi:WD40 repeat protein
LLWDAATGRSLGGPLRHDAAVRAMTFSPDGRTVLTGGEDGTARFWDAATGKPQGEPLQTGGPVWGVFFSPGAGKTILTTDKTTGRLWDVASRRPIGVPLPNEGEPVVWPPLFSPDGRVLATRSDSDTVVHLWKTATGKRIGQPLSFKEDAAITSQVMIDVLAFSPDGRVFLVGCSGRWTAHLLDTATGTAIETSETLTPRAAFSPDGKVLASACDDGTMRLFEAATGKLLGEPLQPLGSPRPLAVSVMVFSPDGKTLLTGSYDNTAQLWNAATGGPISGPLRHEGSEYALGGAYRVSLAPNNPRGISSVGFSANGALAMTAGQDQAIRFWNAATGEPVAPPLRHRGPVSGLRFSPDRAIGVSQTAEGSGWFWETATGRPLALLPEHQGPYQVQGFCAGGRTVLTSGREGFLHLLEVPITGTDDTRLPHDGVMSVAFSPDGRTALTGGTDSMARKWEAPGGKPIGTPLRHDLVVNQVAFSPDGRTLVTATADQGVHFWEAATGKAFGEPPPKQGTPYNFTFAANAILFRNQAEAAQLWDLGTGKPAGPPLPHPRLWARAASPNGRTMLTAGVDGTAQLWNGITGQRIGPPLQHEGMVTFMTFSPDGRMALTGSMDHTARRWDAATGNPIGQPLQHPGGVAGIAFSPDGKTILTGCQDLAARFWDAATGAPLGPRLADEAYSLPHQDYVWTVAFSPDGRVALTGTKGQTYYLWEVATRKSIGALRHDGPITSWAFSPDGRLLLTGSSDTTARLWDTATGKVVGPPLLHRGAVDALAFSPTGRTVLTGGSNDVAHLRPVPEPMTGEAADILAWVEGLTGMELDTDEVVRWLDAAAWEEHRLGLRQRARELAWPAEELRLGKVAAPDLSKVKPALDDNFADAKSGFQGAEDKGDGWVMGYENGKYVIHTEMEEKGSYACWPCPGQFPGVACQVVGRTFGQHDQDGWGLFLWNEDERAVAVKLSRDGTVGVGRCPALSRSFPVREMGPIHHAAIKPGDEANRLLVVLRGQILEVYVNGVAVCQPIVLPQDITPVGISLAALPQKKGARVEFQRLTIWPSDALPSPTSAKEPATK